MKLVIYSVQRKQTQNSTIHLLDPISVTRDDQHGSFLRAMAQ